ncbi:MAG: DUF1330 domain-containing protein [Alphaproteobacteria bacterium]|nr:DUF1330 domain-containing protein [Alphaproteobacteria bacterium]MBU1515669.1 DUF1330 domain-containing protein [Alphaproteobacteria bacterium]MBU2094928.1 DUF1330 domain-containing protein [Alphaproteobacteria bacterium]MBU2150960.1 DUF1330 domain-containing protein [Alphaproteobacteria bacterium]MBU2305937.1 DUF1330 domain-containing protein [Alphaproteobacteria bacterium]
MKVENAVFPQPPQAMAFFGGTEDGPFVMVNLLKFKPKAEYADGSDTDLSGADAYARYGDRVRELVEGLGGKVRYSGDVTGLLLGEVEDLWDMVALAEYPSLAAFRAMALSPEMQAIEHHRKAGLAGQLNIRTRPSDGF